MIVIIHVRVEKFIQNIFHQAFPLLFILYKKMKMLQCSGSFYLNLCTLRMYITYVRNLDVVQDE